MTLGTPVSLLALSLLHICTSVPSTQSINWLRQCRTSDNLSVKVLEVLPGGGWDNLRNMDVGRVMNLSYLQCRTTEDGLYLIPDEVFIIPQKETRVETSSEIVASWLEQRSVTSNTINSDVSFLSVLNGKFSSENQRIKTHQVKESSTTSIVQVRDFIYTVKAFPNTMLDAHFAKLATEIADAIVNNQTKYADYLSEKMVLDYGTHVIMSVDAGASLVEEDYLTSSYVSDNSSQTLSIKALASLNFFDKLKFDISSQNTHQSLSLQTYQSKIEYSLVESHGGDIPFYPGITLQKWQESTRNNLVAIDRSGIPLHSVINVGTLADLPSSTIYKVSQKVKQAIQRYYQINTRPGCVDVNSQNFNFQANLDDKSCTGPVTNLSFGGVYQQCTEGSRDKGPLCDALEQKNPDTGDFSCRSPYRPTLLRSEVRKQAYMSNDCHEESFSCGIFGWMTCHRTVCMECSHVRWARIETHWCSTNEKAPDYSGFLFGGLYTQFNVNPITKAKNCPPNFFPAKFLSDGQVICLSNDYEMGTKSAVLFGGLFSCEASNPLAGHQRRCPPTFSQHLATISDGCEILYCVKSGLFTSGELQPIRLPPFTQPPLMITQESDSVFLMSEGDKNWVKVGDTKTWKLAEPEEVAKVLLKLHPELKPMSGGEKAGIVFGVVGLMVVVVAVIMWRKKRQAGAVSVQKVEYNVGTLEAVESQRLLEEA